MPKIPFGLLSLATGSGLNRLSDEVFQGFLDVSLTFFLLKSVYPFTASEKVRNDASRWLSGVTFGEAIVFHSEKATSSKETLPGGEAGTRQVAEAETGGTRRAEVNLLLGNSLNFSRFSLLAGSNQRQGWECLRHLLF